jgi:DNA-binding NarL/FixJ family response regulator
MQDDHKRYNLDRENKAFEFVPNKGLTKREKEVLKNIAIGNKMEIIADQLGISESTIKNHKTRIFKKLHARTAAEAVFYASKQNII